MATARILLRHPLIVALLLLGTLLMRALIPAGYMPVASGGSVTLQLCPGTVPIPAAPMAGMHHGSGKHETPMKAEQPCAFAGLAMPALGTADPVLLAAAIAFVLLLVRSGSTLTIPTPRGRFRPPLRAPPLTA